MTWPDDTRTSPSATVLACTDRPMVSSSQSGQFGAAFTKSTGSLVQSQFTTPGDATSPFGRLRSVPC